MTLNRVPIPSPNYSTRGGSTVRLIVLHTAEGATSYTGLGSYFSDPASGVSSHVGIDDTPNTVGEYVRRDGSAWTAANANPIAVQAELCAFAAWNNAIWNSHPNMLANCAAWIAEEAAALGIPIVRLSAAQAQGGGVGVCQHIDLGAWGGGHVDCGAAFPMDQVLEMAREGPQRADEEDPDVILIRNTKGAVSVYNGATKQGVESPTTMSGLEAAGLKVANVSDQWYQSIPDAPQH